MNKAPAFQFYAQDFLTGVMYLTNEEKGIYITMLAKQWTDGKIPKKRLGFLVGFEWEDLSEELRSKFKDHGLYVVNTRLEEEREKKKTFLKKQKNNGSKGGRPPKYQNPSKSQKKPLEDEIEKEEEEEIEKVKFKGGLGEFSPPPKNPMELELEDLKLQMQNEATWKEIVCKNVREADRSFNMDSLEDYLEQFFKTIETDGEEYKTVKDTKKHFSRWLAIEIKNKNNGKGKSTHQNSSGPSDEYRRKTAERLGLKQS